MTLKRLLVLCGAVAIMVMATVVAVCVLAVVKFAEFIAGGKEE